MNIFEIISNLYTNKNSLWIRELDDNLIQPFIIQRFLSMNDALRVQVRWLDPYVFYLPVKMYLSLAWSVIPKLEKAPYIRYIKESKDEEEYEFILSKIRHHMNLSDNDYNAQKTRIIEYMKKDMQNWFSFYGIEKKYWKQYNLQFDKIKEFNVKNKQTQKGLSAWALS